jgi:HD superfamily phosphodiesterase
MNDILALPTGPLVDASLALVQKTESTPIADHSIRSFLFARLLAEQEGCLNDAAYDENLLFAACVMHDLGLGTLAAGQARFEVEGADLAASVLTEHGIASGSRNTPRTHALGASREPPPAHRSHARGVSSPYVQPTS